MVAKRINEGSLKQAKLAKTKGRRERLGRGKRIADIASTARRNDLLPDLALCDCLIADLRPPARRTRKNSPEQIERIARSITEFGFSQPILVRAGQVLDGWSRVLAAKELGLEKVSAVNCTHLDDAQARALAIALNRVAERGEWDLDELKIEFEALIELDVDLEATGFSIEERDIILLDPLDDEQETEEQLEPPEQPVTRLGDIWRLGAHRVICADALDELTYRTLLEGESVHAVLTDPPFNVRVKNNVSGLGKKVHDEFVMASGEMSDDEFQAFLDRVFGLLAKYLVAGGVLFAFIDWRSLHRVYAAGEAAALKLINLVVWYKEVGAMGGLYRSAHELLPVFCKGEHPRVNNVSLGSHATPKPIELCVDAILDVTRPGELVLDAFLGSGTTLAAAEKAGRVCRGIELEPKFVDVAVRRWEKLTGGQAVLAETGERFAEASQRRAAEAQSAAGDAPKAGEAR
jgi:DNA modification methylase